MYEIVIGRTESDKKELGLSGTIFLGKHYVKMGQSISLSNPVLMDVTNSHIVLISGKRGSGKCLTGDTLIQLADGSQIEIEKLKENNEKILSLNDNLKIESTEKSEFFEREVKEIIKIKLRSGKELKLTPEHPLFTIKGWQPVENLKIGSRIATPRKIPTFGKEELEDYKIKLLAYLIAEGHTKKIVLFANQDPKIIKEFEESLKEFDPNLELRKEKEAHYRITEPNWKNKVKSYNIIRNEYGQFMKGTKIETEQRSIRKLITQYKLFNKLSIEKEIPLEITKLPKEKLALFLNRLFSCDGSIYKTANHIEISYSSSSKKLIKIVQSLLLKYEILSKLRNKTIKCNNKIFKSYELVINEENSLKYIKEIGFFGIKHQKATEWQEPINTKRNPNVDTIPKEIWELYRPKNWAQIGRILGYAHPKAMRERIRYSPSRQTILQIAKAEEHNGLKTLAESDIFWDEIIEIKLLEGNFKVYDICVPEFHNFIANDIIVHNSYTLGVIAEEICNLPDELRDKIAVFMFDTMGIFWTMKYQNDKDEDLLAAWQLPKKSLDIDIYTPKGFYQEYKEKGIPTDYEFAIKPNDLSAEDWCLVFDIKITDPIGILVERILEQLENQDYSIDDIIELIKIDAKTKEDTKQAAENRYIAAKNWGLFDIEGTPIKNLIKGGKTTVLDVSCYENWNVKNLVIGIIARKLMKERMIARKEEELKDIQAGHSYFSTQRDTTKNEKPLVWMLLDEAHEALPKEGKTPATDALVQVLREGRQPGISLILATQQPGEIHKDVMTQSDIIISHRVTARKDINALNSIMQSYIAEDIMKYLNQLPRQNGSAIILDDNSERIFPMRVRPRFTWHGGEAPKLIKAKGRAAEELGL